MQQKDFKAIIFDLFHTLTSLESTKVPGRSTKDILGVSRKDWNNQLLFYSDDRLRGRIKDPFEIIAKNAHAINPSISEERIREAANSRIKRFKFSLEYIEQTTIDVLERLKTSSKLLGLITNADVSEITGWNNSPLKKYFNSVVFSCTVGYIKPEKEIYEICLSELGVLPGEVLYIGDGGSEELRGAKELGMTTVLTTHVIKNIWPEEVDKRRKYANYEIDNLKGLFELK